MDNVSIFVGFTTAILGLAYPIILQVISNLDEKYHSMYIIQIFKKEKWFISYRILLVCSVILIGIYVLNLEPIFSNENINKWLYGSAIVLVGISNGFLLLSFFRLFSILLKYSTTRELVKLIERKHFKNANENQIFFRAMADILDYAIGTNQEEIIQTIFNFYDNATRHENE